MRLLVKVLIGGNGDTGTGFKDKVATRDVKGE